MVKKWIIIPLGWMLHVGIDLQVHVLQINASLSLRQFMFFLSKIFYKIYNILTSHLKSSNIVTFLKCVGEGVMTPGHLLPLEQLLQMMHVLLAIFGFAWWSRYSSIPGQVLVKRMLTWFKCILHNIWYWSFDQRFYSPQSWYSKQKTF